MSKLNTGYILDKIIEMQHQLRNITTVEEAVKVILPAIADTLGFHAAMLKVRGEDGLFRGHILSNDGAIDTSSHATDLRSYEHFMTHAEKIGNCYFASHEIRIWDSLPGSSGWEDLVEIPDWKPGKWHPEDALLVPVFDQNHELIGLLWPDCPKDGKIPNKEVADILEIFSSQAVDAIIIRQLLESAQKAAITDGLTHLHTHRHFQECLSKEVAEAHRHQDIVSLMMMDIDHFKNINDTYGHVIGDKVLRGLSKHMQYIARGYDQLARYGGEEFAEILPRTNTLGAYNVAQRLQNSLHKDWDLELPKITVSIGIASCPQNASNKNDLIQAADNALLEAKRLGRNRVCICGTLAAIE